LNNDADGWHNNCSTWTLLETNSFCILFPAKSIVSYRWIISSHLYFLFRGTCGLASQAH